jgi:hypothetical protein
LIVFGLVALYASTSRSVMQCLSGLRDHNGWWGAYQGKNGDLLSMAHLEIVGKFNPVPDKVPFKRRNYTGSPSTALYLHGDSYTRHLNDSLFEDVLAYHYIDRNHGSNYHLDSTKRNILVIEISERYFRSYFGSLQMLDEVCDSLVKKKKITSEFSFGPAKQYASVVPPISIDAFFNSYINQNLQFNLFNYNFMMPLFECKAAINYYFFNRASGDVIISDDRNLLFLKETVSRTDIGSSYATIESSEITQLVDNLNAIYDHYIASGFQEVYLSLIPNSATINQPAGYNNLIPAIQTDARLRMKIMDVYSAFKKSPELLYQAGDTHWNYKGKQLWLDVVNEKLAKDQLAPPSKRTS